MCYTQIHDKNASSVYGTIGKALNQIRGDIVVILQRQKCCKYALCTVCDEHYSFFFFLLLTMPLVGHKSE